MSTLAGTDAFLVSRGGVNYQVTASNLMSTLLDTDLLLVNRSGTNFKITGLDAKSYFGTPVYATGEFVSGIGPYFYYNPNTQLVVGWSQQPTSLPGSEGPAAMFFSQDDGATWKFIASAGGGYYVASTPPAQAGIYEMAYSGLVFQNDTAGLVYQTSPNTPTASITSFAGITTNFSNTTITSSGGSVSGPEFPSSTGWVQNPNTGTIVKVVSGRSGAYNSAWYRWTGWGTTAAAITAATDQREISSLNYLPAVNRWLGCYSAGSVYFSSNDGATFTASTGATNVSLYGFATNGTTIIGVGRAFPGNPEVWVSSNGGTSFSSGFTATALDLVSVPFYVNGKFHYYFSPDSGVTIFLRSSPNGTTWTQRDVSAEFPGDMEPIMRSIGGVSIVVTGSYVFVGAIEGGGFTRTGSKVYPHSYFI
jgi:hypothetical protein